MTTPDRGYKHLLDPSDDVSSLFAADLYAWILEQRFRYPPASSRLSGYRSFQARSRMALKSPSGRLIAVAAAAVAVMRPLAAQQRRKSMFRSVSSQHLPSEAIFWSSGVLGKLSIFPRSDDL
jgi:hypothetical protein